MATVDIGRGSASQWVSGVISTVAGVMHFPCKGCTRGDGCSAWQAEVRLAVEKSVLHLAPFKLLAWWRELGAEPTGWPVADLEIDLVSDQIFLCPYIYHERIPTRSQEHIPVCSLPDFTTLPHPISAVNRG